LKEALVNKLKTLKAPPANAPSKERAGVGLLFEPGPYSVIIPIKQFRRGDDGKMERHHAGWILGDSR